MLPVLRHRKSLVAIAVVLSTIITVLAKRRAPSTPPSLPAKREVTISLFADRYPVQTRFQQELQLLRSQGKLKQKNESRIAQSIQKTSTALKMPPAVLWCLLFQESRLNHLQGWKTDRSSRGIGQFSFFSFYEINHHLDRFNGDNLQMFRTTLGGDIRPLVADEDRLDNPSSYFFIPTAVATSAAYLNNRYLQLRQILDRRGYRYHPDLLWLYAAMAYNKGTRSVLSFWNDALRTGGPPKLQRILVDEASFLKSVSDPNLVLRTLRRIWPPHQAEAYAQELRIHLKNMWACAVDHRTDKEVNF